jgi:phosphoglycerate dehydrogenase-like enzyme
MTHRISVSIPDDSLAPVLDRPDVDRVDWDMTDAPPQDTIDLVVPPYLGGSKRWGLLDGVGTRLVQIQSIGYDGVAERLPGGLVLANAASVHETATSELTLALILAAQRDLPAFVRAQEREEWTQHSTRSLADSRVLLLGYGGVGKAIEDRLLPFETTVTRVASRARSDERGAIHGIDELGELLPLHDIVVVGVPLTDDTRGLVDADFLAAMPDDALFVNIARGPVADDDALVAAARSGRLRFALDVTDPEPLPAGHPLWSLPNVLITPHVGGASAAMLPRMRRLLERQIDLMLAGHDPVNVVIRS